MPAFTSYSTKVQNPIMIHTVCIDGEQYFEFDVSLAAVYMCLDGIKAVLASDGMGMSLQWGVYPSFFTNRRFRKDLGEKYNKDVAASQLIAKYVTDSRRRRVCKME
jgi:hypothetical protein